MVSKMQRGVSYGCAYALISLLLAACNGAVTENTANVVSNLAPSIFGNPPTAVFEGSSYAFTPAATDPDFDVLSFSINKMPAWAEFDTDTGALTGSPDGFDIGVTTNIVISVDDGFATDSLPAFNLTVESLGAGDIVVGNTLPATYVWGVLDVGETVYVDRDYTYTNIPVPHRGLRYLRTENNDKNVSAPDAVSFTVDRAVTVLVAYDSAISVLPAWLQSWAASGLGWSNSSSSIGDVYQKDFAAGSVVLGGNEMGFSMYGLAIAEQGTLPSGGGNSIPSISGVPETVANEGVAYSFVPTASDGDQDRLTFSIDNQPGWANFDPDSGALTGQPSAVYVDTYSDITISVSDGQATVSLAPFDIEVLGWANGSASLTWAAPTQNVDGSTIDDLAGYKVYYSKNPANGYPDWKVLNSLNDSYVVQNLSAGTWSFVVTAFNQAGAESDFSVAASKTIVASSP